MPERVDHLVVQQPSYARSFVPGEQTFKSRQLLIEPETHAVECLHLAAKGLAFQHFAGGLGESALLFCCEGQAEVVPGGGGRRGVAGLYVLQLLADRGFGCLDAGGRLRGETALSELIHL